MIASRIVSLINLTKSIVKFDCVLAIAIFLAGSRDPESLLLTNS